MAEEPSNIKLKISNLLIYYFQKGINANRFKMVKRDNMNNSNFSIFKLEEKELIGEKIMW